MTRIYVDTIAVRDNRRYQKHEPVVKVETDGVVTWHHGVALQVAGVEVGRMVYEPDGGSPRVWLELADGVTLLGEGEE